jgi:hypothetical protein
MSRALHPRRRPSALAAAALALIAALAPAPAAAQASDEATAPRRMLAAHEQAEFRGVGRLDVDGAYCTATLFDERHALTAAHCLFGPDGRPAPVARLRFRAGFREGGEQAVRGVRRVVVHPGWRWSGRRADLATISADLALLELDQPLLTSRFPNYGPAAMPPPGAPVVLLSYGRGRDRALSLQDPCHVVERGGGVARLSCDASPGSSGSPVLARFGGRLHLVGVVSAAGPLGAYATDAAAALPALRAAQATAGPQLKRVRPGEGSLSARPGAWKASRPPQP